MRDADQLLERVHPAALAVERQRQIESRLVVERIGGDFLLELGDRPERFRLLGKIERGLGRDDGRVIALGLGHHGERLPRLLERAGLDITAHQAGKSRDVGIVLGQQLGIEVGRAGGIARGERGVGGFEQILGLAADAVFGQALQEGNDLTFRDCPHEAVGGLAVDEGDHRRNRLDAHLARQGRVLVDVHLDELDLALRGADRFFEHRAELLARPAPRRPEIDQHRLALGFLDDVLDESLGRRVLDDGFRRDVLRLLQHRP